MKCVKITIDEGQTRQRTDKTKDGQDNDQKKKKDKRTNNDLQKHYTEN
jgi:hypothetical protein